MAKTSMSVQEEKEGSTEGGKKKEREKRKKPFQNPILKKLFVHIETEYKKKSRDLRSGGTARFSEKKALLT